jgi:hypothetical protein
MFWFCWICSPILCAWKGTALASQSKENEIFKVTKKEYEEHGSNICLKCFSATYLIESLRSICIYFRWIIWYLLSLFPSIGVSPAMLALIRTKNTWTRWLVRVYPFCDVWLIVLNAQMIVSSATWKWGKMLRRTKFCDVQAAKGSNSVTVVVRAAHLSNKSTTSSQVLSVLKFTVKGRERWLQQLAWSSTSKELRNLTNTEAKTD